MDLPTTLLMSIQALKTITAELPQNSSLAPKACANLTPKLLNQVQNVSYLILLLIIT